MKILFVNNFRGRGGGEEFLRDLLPGLAAKNIEVGLVCRPNTPLVEMFQGSEVTLHPLDRSGIRGFTSVLKMASLIRERGYRIINIQRGHDIIQTWLAALLSGRKPLLMYTPQVPEFIRSRFLLRRMDAIATISRYIRDELTSFDPTLASRISIVYYGIDLSRFKPEAVPAGWLRKRFGLSPATKILGSVGDLWKNQIEFLDVLAELKKEIPDIRYAMVASESGIGQIETFKRRAAELGLTDSVLWAGRLAKNDMLSFYADMDLAVSTYRNEGFGIWILEAMAMGKPVVAYNAGGIRDSLEGSPSGALVNGGPREMAAAILKLLADGPRRKTMAERAPAWVRERFRRERMIDDYAAFFRSLAGYSPRPRRILQIISKNDKYGAQRIFLDQVAALRDLGHEVTVVARGEGYVSDSVRALGVTYHGIPMKGFRDILFLRRLVKSQKIDIIHSTLERADYAGLIVGRLTGVPVVSTMMVPRCHSAYRFMDRIVVLSRKQRDILLAHGVAPSKIEVIRPGIDINRFSRPDPIRREAWRTRTAADRFDIVFSHIASMHQRKGHLVSLNLLTACKERGANPLLFVIGDPLECDYVFSLKSYIQEQALDEHVVFTGWTKDIPEILSLSHYTLLPSDGEALGVALMEGMAAGTPIIARAGEGGAELVEEREVGFLYRPEEGVAPLADRILSLHRNGEKYRTYSDSCKSIAVCDFSLERFGRQLLKLYATVRGERGT